MLEGSEAQAKGVTKGDFVQAINGESGHVWSASEVIGALGRMEGENVVVTWMRPISMDAENGNEFTTTLECREYTAENVTSELMDEGVGYIKLRQLTANASELVKRALVDLSAAGLRHSCWISAMIRRISHPVFGHRQLLRPFGYARGHTDLGWRQHA